MKRSAGLCGFAALFILLLPLVSCDLLPGFITGDEDRGFVALQFSLVGTNITDAASVKLELSSDGSLAGFSRTVPIDSGNNTAYTLIPEVPAGWWFADVTVYNSAGAEITTDTFGDDMEVVAGEILTIEVIYDPSLGTDLTITGTSASTVQPAVSINSDSLDVTLVLFRDSDFSQDVQNITTMEGSGEFQAASVFSFLYPDGTTIEFSQRSMFGESEIEITDTTFSCMRSSAGYGTGGTFEVRVTDLYGISASATREISVYNTGENLAEVSYPPQGDVGTFDPAVDTDIQWTAVDSEEIQSVVVLLIEKAMLTTGSPDFVSPPLSGTAAGVTVPSTTGLMLGVEYKLILLTFDEVITDTSVFYGIMNLSPESLLSYMLTSPDHNFGFIGMSYSSFTTRT